MKSSIDPNHPGRFGDRYAALVWYPTLEQQAGDRAFKILTVSMRIYARPDWRTFENVQEWTKFRAPGAVLILRLNRPQGPRGLHLDVPAQSGEMTVVPLNDGMGVRLVGPVPSHKHAMEWSKWFSASTRKHSIEILPPVPLLDPGTWAPPQPHECAAPGGSMADNAIP